METYLLKIIQHNEPCLQNGPGNLAQTGPYEATSDKTSQPNLAHAII